jgi:hypothetical protein
MTQVRAAIVVWVAERASPTAAPAKYFRLAGIEWTGQQVEALKLAVGAYEALGRCVWQSPC